MELSSKVTVVVRNGLVSIVAVVAAIGAFASVDPLVNPEMGWPLKDLATLGTAPVVLPLIVVLEFDVDPDGGPAHEAEACQSTGVSSNLENFSRFLIAESKIKRSS